MPLRTRGRIHPEDAGQRVRRLPVDFDRAGLAVLFALEAVVAAGRCRAEDARAAFVDADFALGFALGLAAGRAGAWARAAGLATARDTGLDDREAVGREAGFAADFAFAVVVDLAEDLALTTGLALAAGLALATGLGFVTALGLAAAFALATGLDLTTGLALATGFGLGAGFTRDAALGFATGLALATGFGLALRLVIATEARAKGLAWVAGLVAETAAGLGLGAVFAALADLAAGFRAAVELTAGDLAAVAVAAGDLAAVGGAATGLAAGAGLSGACAAGAGVGAGGWAVCAASTALEAAPSERSTGGRGPLSDTRTGSTMSSRSSAARSGVSAVSRQVKATTSLKSGCRSKRTIAVWLSTVSTTPLEPIG
jgi:hypothetical protein